MLASPVDWNIAHTRAHAMCVHIWLLCVPLFCCLLIKLKKNEEAPGKPHTALRRHVTASARFTFLTANAGTHTNFFTLSEVTGCPEVHQLKRPLCAHIQQCFPCALPNQIRTSHKGPRCYLWEVFLEWRLCEQFSTFLAPRLVFQANASSYPNSERFRHGPPKAHLVDWRAVEAFSLQGPQGPLVFRGLRVP
ncbi:hypothetical protein EYF80_026496 [Liparis tanakae]|uniref:Uncharacterized protein n=1 Tax=Liparis tanakae TaxID=230148 RepID=A0A4Z2HDA8_9TELE|nr:hypothetical protein EYF80_026496 [Liparis tanakae]